MRRLADVCSRMASEAFRAVGTFLIGVGFVASLPVLALGWLAFYAAPRLISGRSGASRTPRGTNGSAAKTTSAPSTRRYDDITLERLARSSGSSSSSGTGDPTSTSSRADLLTKNGSPLRGSASSAPEIPHIELPERASRGSSSGDRRRFRTQESTLASKSKRNCRPCSWLRALAGGGV